MLTIKKSFGYVADFTRTYSVEIALILVAYLVMDLMT